MKNLYSRLQAIGFEKAFVKGHVLPDWWEDDLALDPGNRRLAELAISRTLSISLSALADPEAPLSLGASEDVRFKRWQATEKISFLPAVAVARRVFDLLLSCAENLPSLRLRRVGASELRNRILTWSDSVTLPELLQQAWDFGVPVVHLGELPKGAKRVDGMAFLVRDRPCIALTSSRKSPAFLIWHLAHELGHIDLGHLDSGNAIAEQIDLNSDLDEEKEANLFATSLLYGSANFGGFRAARHITGEQLAHEAQQLAAAHQIWAGCIVTSYGFNMSAWGTAQRALQALGVADTGPGIVQDTLRERVDLDRLTDTDRNFFARATGLFG
jgi:hypothetical protein